MRTNTLFPLLIAMLLVWSQSARAEMGMASQSLDDIRAAAMTAMGGQGDATVATNVHFAQCAQPLQAVASGAHTALVRCPDAPGWRLYVPVRTHRDANVVVLRGPVRAGVPITADQLVIQRRDIADAAAQPIENPADAIGRSPARALAGGAPLTSADLVEGPPLKRGDPVVLLTRIGSVEVRVAGRALGVALPGGVVSAENTDSHRVVRGRLAAPGVIEVLQ